MIETIDKEPWNYILYSKNGKFILSVLCGSSAIYETTIELNQQEEKAVNEGKVKELVRQIQNSPTRFASRKIQGFSHPGAK